MTGTVESELVTLIGLIYESTNAPDRWPELFNELDAYLAASQSLTQVNGEYVVVESLEQNLLYPHLQQALSLNQKIHSAQQELNSTLAILNKLPLGIILIDEQLNILSTNAHSQAFLSAEYGLEELKGKLQALHPENQIRIEHAIQNLSKSDIRNKHLNECFTIAGSAKSDGFYTLHFSRSNTTATAGANGVYTLFISHSNKQSSVNVNEVSRVYELTGAEGRLVKQLLNGSNSLTEAAEKLCISKHTARSHFKNVLTKTNTHSQSQLLKQIYSNPALWFSPAETEEASKLQQQAIAHYNNTKTVRTKNGIELSFADYGRVGGKPVLFLHGYFHSQKYWQQKHDELKKSEVRVIVLNRWDFQKQADLAGLPHSTEFDNAIQLLLASLQIKNPLVVAESTGASVALANACSQQPVSNNLILINPYPDNNYYLEVPLMASQSLLLKAYQKLPAFSRKHISRLMFSQLHSSPGNYFERIYNKLPKADKTIVSNELFLSDVQESFDWAFHSESSTYLDDFTQLHKTWPFDLQNCNANTTIIHGADNSVFIPAISEKMVANIPSASNIKAKGAGQYMLYSHWHLVMETMLEHLHNS